MNNKIQEIISKIRLLLSSIEEDNVIKIKKKLYKSIAELQLQCVEKEKFFSTYLNSLVKDLSTHIFNSDSDFKKRNLNDLRINLLIEYEPYLKNLTEHKKFEEECLKDALKSKSSLLEKNILSRLNDEYPISYIPKIIDSLVNHKKDEFKTKFRIISDKKVVKQSILFFYDDLISHIPILKKHNIELKRELDTSIKKLKAISDGVEKYILEDGETIELNNFESHHSDIKQVIDEVEITDYHLDKLISLEKELYQSYIFLKELRPKTLSKQTVFNKVKPEHLDSFIDELSDFTEPQLRNDDLKEVFLLEYLPKNKVNLINGTLVDFGSLMHKLKPYFIPELSKSKDFNLWWSDRFTFKNKEKDTKAISNIISSFNKGERITTKTQKIKVIIQQLDKILH